MKFKKTFKRLVKFFGDDYEKTMRWFITPNPLLGNVAPMMMIATDRIDKLCQFINSHLDGNLP